MIIYKVDDNKISKKVLLLFLLVNSTQDDCLRVSHLYYISTTRLGAWPLSYDDPTGSTHWYIYCTPVYFKDDYVQLQAFQVVTVLKLFKNWMYYIFFTGGGGIFLKPSEHMVGDSLGRSLLRLLYGMGCNQLVFNHGKEAAVSRSRAIIFEWIASGLHWFIPSTLELMQLSYHWLTIDVTP